MRLVTLFEPSNLVLIQCDVQRSDGLFQVLDLGQPQHRSRDPRPAQQPGEGVLRRLRAAASRHFHNAVHDLNVLLLIIEPVGVFVGFGSNRVPPCGSPAIARQETASRARGKLRPCLRHRSTR